MSVNYNAFQGTANDKMVSLKEKIHALFIDRINSTPTSDAYSDVDGNNI